MVTIEPIILKNEYLTVKLSQKGAAIVEILSSDDKTLICGGDTFLFPVCAGVNGGRAMLGNKNYKMCTGGFAKDKQFEVLEYMEDYAEFILTADDETVAHYPFSFNLIITYKLLGNAVEINCTIGNFSEYKMPYSFGFDLFFKGCKSVEFENDEIFEGYPVTNGIVYSPPERLSDDNGKTLDVENDMSFVIKDVISDSLKVLTDSAEIRIYHENLRNVRVCKSDDVAQIGFWNGMPDIAGQKSGYLNTQTSNLLSENSTTEQNYLITFKK